MPFRRFVTGGGGEESDGGSVGGLGTGLFTRNCVLSGKHSADMSFPLYIRTPGLVSPVSGLSPEGLGYFESSEGTATNAFPGHNDLALNTTYWSASSTGAWLAYHHSLRPTTIRGYRFVTTEGYTPSSWVIEGSNDGENWTTIHEVTSYTWGTGKQVAEETAPEANRGEYIHHRFVVNGLDGTSVRIYSLQFWDAACPNSNQFCVDADAEIPLIFAFADGFEEAVPKDILVSVSAVDNLNVTEIADMGDFFLSNDPLPCTLFAVYDTETELVSYDVEPAFADGINPSSQCNQLSILSSTSSIQGSFLDIFDGNASTYITNNYTTSEQWAILEPSSPFYTDYIFFKYKLEIMTSYYATVEISEDFGASWVTLADINGTELTTEYNSDYITLDRVYNVTKIKVRLKSGGSTPGLSRIYELTFNDATGAAIKKIEDGKVYEYDAVTETWNQVHKIPLGFCSLWKNPDGSTWEIGHFIPTHVPQMAIAPFFRKTSGGVVL